MAFSEVRHETRTAPAGICIYCGKDESAAKLSEEHIVPFGLGGHLILPKASCPEHAKLTSAFEGKVLRGFMHHARIAGRFPTRHPKNRPTVVPIEIQQHDSVGFVTEKLPPDAALGMLFLPTFERAAFLAGKPPIRGIQLTGTQIIGFGKSPENLRNERNAKALRGTARIEPHDFMRMLAKIGYSFAVSVIGPYPLAEVPVLPLILGRADDDSTWIGSADYHLDVEAKHPQHALSLVKQRGIYGGKPVEMLVALVKLFSSSGATGYEVVVQLTQGDQTNSLGSIVPRSAVRILCSSGSLDP